MSNEQIFCPACGAETEHSLIKSGQERLMRCSACGEAHPVQRERERLADVKVIVNRGDESRPYQIRLGAKDELCVGMELLVDDEHHDVVITQIASIETDRRVEAAPAGEIKTVWARAIDQVDVKLSVYRKGRTQSLKLPASGEDTFELGEIMKADGLMFEVTKIKLRGEGFADSAMAKDILRVWGREL
jgi:uncharacterized Zn finger protein